MTIADHDAIVQVHPWLQQFPESRRSGIANWFHYAARREVTTPQDLLSEVARTLEHSLLWSGLPPEARRHMEQVCEALFQPHAQNYAQSVLSRESLPPDTKQHHKQLRSRHFMAQRLATRPPTDRQLAYLKTLGYRGKAPTTALDASQAIDRLRGTTPEATP